MGDIKPWLSGEAVRQLKGKGYTDREAKEKIASVVLGDIYDILSGGKKFDEDAYNSKLKLLVEETVMHCRSWDGKKKAESGLRIGLERKGIILTV
ncbi:hypothetical protein [Anaerocolumna sp. MB42-C2]|uniref:hypothetical protein n=1 Tax=Anaerocolumna sp. MB42-C2 TaxID=3070997 RepID=UPI0027DF5BFC|nr:hypothetical protein [Anaerocolumna sp. MB42-C2]WMJ89769.1 hypothetical protein RBU59_09615 [Anaerocolumna sp. MB42-C2]